MYPWNGSRVLLKAELMTETSDENAHQTLVWVRYAFFALFMASGVILLYFSTVSKMVDIWIRSETFTHGFLVVPISLWLVWEKRGALARLSPKPDLRVLVFSLPVGLCWLLGDLVDVLVVQQFAFVAMLIVVLWTLLGRRATGFLAFPLAFLFFAVPVGEGLLSPMMEFTTDFTVRMLQITGIPVYREGTFFSIPSGDWSVVEACSGVRYLIASVTLGTLYAYMTYSRIWKRLIFIAAAIVVPIFANGMRAYLIVMIGHLSDMKLAVGIDHFIYGWVWFGIVITIMFLIGAIWRDPLEPAPPQAPLETVRSGAPGMLSMTLAICLTAAGLWPLLAWAVQQDMSGNAKSVTISPPPGTQGWHLSDTAHWDWKPHIINPDDSLYRFYEKDGYRVGLYLGVYMAQKKNADLVNSQNQIVRQQHPVWLNKGRFSVPMVLGGTDISVQQTRLVGRGQRLLVRHWYRVGSQHTANDYVAKLLEAVSLLPGRRKDRAFIVVATPYELEMSEAESVLQAFMDSMLPGIEQALDQTADLQ